MEVKDFQNKIIEFIAAWDKKRNSEPNEPLVFAHIVEEVGELARQYVNKESRRNKFDEKEIENSIGDILMQTIKLAHLKGLDVEEVVLKIIKEEEKLL